MTDYVKCLTPNQDVCTHSFCLENTPKCGQALPVEGEDWRVCIKSDGHAGPHYTPPTSFNYRYWK